MTPTTFRQAADESSIPRESIKSDPFKKLLIFNCILVKNELILKELSLNYLQTITNPIFVSLGVKLKLLKCAIEKCRVFIDSHSSFNHQL